ncbi:MAG: SDR family oxidoreductase [Saprospiraceae bacterium]|nr:SDR family oxidoreductase [Saprospiraceae bacterium]
MTKDTILITGGSSGFGLELAHRFAASGHPLVLVALPGKALDLAKSEVEQRYPGIHVYTLPVDLTAADGPDLVFSFIQNKGLTIDGLINNAGFGTWGFLPDISQEKEEAMIHLNILALYRLTRLFLPGMIARKRGQIMHIASIAAFQPNPYMATYGATKAFVRSFSQALERELKDQGSPVRVTTVCPPAARTPFREASGMKDSALFSGWLSVDAPLVADAAFRAYQRKQGLMIPGRLYRILHVLTRFLPEWVSTNIAIQTLRKGLPIHK